MSTTTGAVAIRAREMEQAVMDLRRKGYSYSQISDRLTAGGRPISTQGCWKAAKKALSRVIADTNESVEEQRTIDVQRCDALITAHWSNAMMADDKSTNCIVRLMDRRAALLGLDTPRVIKVEDDRETIDDQLARLAERLKTVNAGREVPITVEIDGTTQSVGTGRRVAQLVDPSGSRLGQDEDRG